MKMSLFKVILVVFLVRGIQCNDILECSEDCIVSCINWAPCTLFDNGLHSVCQDVGCSECGVACSTRDYIASSPSTSSATPAVPSSQSFCNGNYADGSYCGYDYASSKVINCFSPSDKIVGSGPECVFSNIMLQFTGLPSIPTWAPCCVPCDGKGYNSYGCCGSDMYCITTPMKATSSCVDNGCGCHNPAPSGCDNQCGSTKTVDSCGICGGPGLNGNGCCGSLTKDCNGVCGGTGVDNGCGCNQPGRSGCDNQCGSSKTVDTCGICGGPGLNGNGCCDSLSKDCAGVYKRDKIET